MKIKPSPLKDFMSSIVAPKKYKKLQLLRAVRAKTSPICGLNGKLKEESDNLPRFNNKSAYERSKSAVERVYEKVAAIAYGIINDTYERDEGFDSLQFKMSKLGIVPMTLALKGYADLAQKKANESQKRS